VIVGNPPTDDPLTIDPHLILGGERRLVGSVYGSMNPQVAFPQLIELARMGRLKLTELVSRHYGLDESNEAFADLAQGGAGRGLIVFERQPTASLA
jgi:S-(hydroxymethyl)glutathione dehydrogenase / alcohol dehydrogenase